jgi:murein DD-endopeptidase MepM/ murein hydrolase activator NlpD
MRKTFLATIIAALGAYLALPLPGLSSKLGDQISHTRNQIEGKRAHENVLTTQITSYGLRIKSLQGDISGLQIRQDRVQRELDQKQAELNRIRDQLQIVRDRLAVLRKRLAADRKLLAAQLVALYKDQQPDMVTVVLEAHGFTDLLDRSEYLDRITRQNDDITRRVRDTTHQVAVEEARLSDLEKKAQDAANAILAKRNEIADAKQSLVARQSDLKQARDVRARAMARIRASRHDLEGHLHVLERKQEQIQARLAGFSGTVSGGPIRHGSGSFIWPVNGPIVSPFGMRWGRMHEGVDIGVGTGTPIRAAAAGTVSLMQPESASGGYGNYTCVQHSGAIATCYAHQSRFGTSVGAHVSQGQVIGYVGCTGHCFGPHLHFEVRVNGAPVDPLGYL